MTVDFNRDYITLHQCFSTFFGSRHPVRLKKKIGGTLTLDKMKIRGTLSCKKFKKVVNLIFGGTPDTLSRHPCVPRHPGWEPLHYTVSIINIWSHFILTSTTQSTLRAKMWNKSDIFFFIYHLRVAAFDSIAIFQCIFTNNDD